MPALAMLQDADTIFTKNIDPLSWFKLRIRGSAW
ncbi:hypothetical protein EYZ11_003803 [Aspergillus tanneri]|uniref:Uncharacterized protein n=1 Tax=Aspergillus tanneri TaxID=1220188 RepID=A0A4S3JPE2_9EURO|nr:hypothetical protein EYZ11_003803 [Aspergillus tanneri]